MILEILCDELTIRQLDGSTKQKILHAHDLIYCLLVWDANKTVMPLSSSENGMSGNGLLQITLLEIDNKTKINWRKKRKSSCLEYTKKKERKKKG